MKFSIITITRNSAKTLKETIESVQKQSFKDYEHIFVDGYSTDGTVELIGAYKQISTGVVHIFEAEPRGISAAMNEGIRHANGDYILHLHADDTLYDVDVLADVAKFLDEKSPDWLYGKIMVRDNKGDAVGTFPNKKIFQANSEDWFKSWLLQMFNYIPHQSVFIKRDVFDRFSYFDETLASAMDPDLWLRIRKQTKWFYFDRIVSTFRLRADSQTGSKETREQNKKNVQMVQRRHLKGITYLLARFVTHIVRLKQFFNYVRSPGLTEGGVNMIKEQFDVPILFIVFNRPDITAVVLDEIKKIQPKYLYIASDAPRKNKEDEKESVQMVRDLIQKSIDWPCVVKTLYHEKNVGCRAAVSSAVTWFFEHVEEGIILEDDCVPDPTFFDFCKLMLEKYRDDERIMHIGGSNFQQGKKRGESSYYFSRYNHIWGWATWRRAWKYYDVDMKDYPEFVKSEKIKEIWPKKNIQNIWLKKFESVYERKLDTWDYQWTYTIWKKGGVCILPNRNLVSNIGFGAGATHTKRKDIYADMPRYSLKEILHPQSMEINTKADEYYNKHFLLFHRILNKLKAYLL